MTDDKLHEKLTAINLLPCPFCGDTPEMPSSPGSCYDIECGCGQAHVSVQISDYMTVAERQYINLAPPDFRYPQEFIDRAAAAAAELWNTRSI